MKSRGLLLVFLLLVPVVASAVVVGELQSGGVHRFSGVPVTVVNLSRPADAVGSVNVVTMLWVGAPAGGCPATVEVKIFRQLPGGIMNVVGERGPFDVLNGVLSFPINPPIEVVPGDLIGYTQVRNLCGGVANRLSRTDVYAHSNTDPGVGGAPNSSFVLFSGFVANIRASTDGDVVHGYLPVVGSAAGAFGSFFRTSAQLTNRGNQPIAGRLIFHRIGNVGSVSDPSVSYAIPPQQTLSFDDIVAATGTSGIGSMDLQTTSGYPPDVTARIYDDHGAEGTAGFTEELLSTYQAMKTGERGTITVPQDLTNYRLNIGVRSLDLGATIGITLIDPLGTTVKTITRSYQPNYFDQIGVAPFLEGTVPAPNSMIVIEVNAGSLFVYGALTDNRTNDPSIRFPSPY